MLLLNTGGPKSKPAELKRGGHNLHSHFSCSSLIHEVYFDRTDIDNGGGRRRKRERKDRVVRGGEGYNRLLMADENRLSEIADILLKSQIGFILK